MRFEALPVLGGDNEAIFKGLLGMSDADYELLVEDGHIQLDYLQPDGTPYQKRQVLVGAIKSELVAGCCVIHSS